MIPRNKRLNYECPWSFLISDGEPNYKGWEQIHDERLEAYIKK